MKAEILEKLATIEDETELALSVAKHCQSFGNIKRIYVSPNGSYPGERWCYITLESPELHESLKQELGGTMFQGSVALFIRSYTPTISP